MRAGQTTATVVPTLMVRRVAEAIESSGGDSGSLRRVVYGGAPIVPEELRRICRVLPGVLVQVFGRVESGWPLAALSPEDHARIAAGDQGLASSCGRPLPAAGDIALRNSREVAVRSEMTVREFADADGWCGLGDLGELRGEYLYLRGRLDRQINTGYHVYPGEIEDALCALPKVADAFVRGEPDARFGEQIVAYVVTTGIGDGATPDEVARRLDAALRDQLASYKVPRTYHLVSEPPAEAASR